MYILDAVSSKCLPGIRKECWHPARRRTIGDIVATGEEFMTPVSARGRRSAVMVILMLSDEPRFLMLCQQQSSNLDNSGKTNIKL